MTFKYWARTTGRVKKMGKAKRGADAGDTGRSFSLSLSIVSGRHPQLYQPSSSCGLVDCGRLGSMRYQRLSGIKRIL